MMKKLFLRFLSLFILVIFAKNAFSEDLVHFEYRVPVDSKLRADFELKVNTLFERLNHNELLSFFDKSLTSNLHVNIILTNEFKRDIIASFSNGKSELFISPLIITSNDFTRLFSHEIFHLLHFKIKREKSWLSEGLANYFSYYFYGKFNPAEINTAMSRSSVSLTGDFSLNLSELERYGVTVLFIKFASDHCGGEGLLRDIINNKFVGKESINLALKNISLSSEICESFDSLASSFILARVINKRTFEKEEKLFLIDTHYSLEANTLLASKLLKLSTSDLHSFFSQMPELLPLVLPLKMSRLALTLKKTIPNLRIFAYRRAYPLSYKELTFSDISELEGLFENIVIYKY